MNYSETKSGKYTIRTYEDGSKAWYMNGKLHREDSPAYEYQDGYKAWFLNGEYHREDGPAVIHKDGHKSWFLKNKLVYDDSEDNLSKYPNVSDAFKLSIIKYKLTMM